jgi:hypothetical protein
VFGGWMCLISPWMMKGMFDEGLGSLKTKVEAAK